MTTLSFNIILRKDGSTSCNNPALMKNVMSGKIHYIKGYYDLNYNGPYGHPWGFQNDIPIKYLQSELEDTKSLESYLPTVKELSVHIFC